jgi:glycosyltransferase involved in cell wall biosynthesis
VRALLVGPVFDQGHGGGLEIALRDLAAALERRGWEVDVRIDARTASGLGETVMASRLAFLQRWQGVMRHRALMPAALRARVTAWLMPTRYFDHASRNLRQLEAALGEPQPWDVVLVCVEGAPTGTACLVSERHPACVLVSLGRLAEELGEPDRPWLRRFASARIARAAHPYLFRPIRGPAVRLAVFASADWRDRAVRAGLPEAPARTIYFGVHTPPAPPRPVRPLQRLLWVGRLSPEKGLTFVLSAMPALRERWPDLRLTVVAGDGLPAYRAHLAALTRRLRLGEAVTMRAAVPRSALPAVYAEHDALVFHSVSADPVSLVLMEAFAAGLPVVASAAGPEAKLVRDGVTCTCYRSGDTRSLVAAVERLRDDEGLRARLSAAAQDLVRREFSLDAMGRTWDELLRTVAGGGAARPTARPAS